VKSGPVHWASGALQCEAQARANQIDPNGGDKLL
jgi:hypothetical protein